MIRAIKAVAVELGVLVAILIVCALLLASSASHATEMVASYYGAESGKRTASGEAFHPNGMTAAMPGAGRSVAFGSRFRICFLGCVVVRINDVGPARWTHRGIDLSEGAAQAIGLVGQGVGRVEVSRERTN